MENASIFHRSVHAALAFPLLAAGQLAASLPAREIADTESSTAPRLLHDPVAVASAPLPDLTPKPVVLPPAVVLDTLGMGIGDATRWRQQPNTPIPPVFPPGKIAFRLTEGDAANQAALADMETLHNLYRTDGHRLKLAHEIREKAILERQSWLEANPPQPQDTIVRHWDVPTARPSPPPAESTETEAHP